MNFLAALAAKLIEKLVTWIVKLISREIKEAKEINQDNAKAEENFKKYDEAQTKEEKRKHAEDLLNGK